MRNRVSAPAADGDAGSDDVGDEVGVRWSSAAVLLLGISKQGLTGR